MGRRGEAADLADEPLGPVLDVALPGVRLGDPDPATGDDVRDDVQPLHLVGPAWVVRPDRQVRPLEVLDQADACALVLHQQQIHPLAILTLAEDRLVLLDHLGPQIRVLHPLLPAVDHHRAHRAVQGLEHPERYAGRRVVLHLL